jgi:DNA-binding IscR family transcriptional regulator
MKKREIHESIKKVAEWFGVSPDVVVIGIADDEGRCITHLQGEENKVACLVNEVMGVAVAKMPQLMQEVMLAEIMANGNLRKNETH